MGEFADKVFSVVKQIPRGKVASYGQVGRLLGAPRSARYVGYALRANPAPGTDPASIPCHRVVFKDGSMASGFAFGGPDIQRGMLEEEGVIFTEDGCVDMESCQWDESGFQAHGGTLCDICKEPVCKHKGKNKAETKTDVPTSPPSDFDWARELGED